MREIKFRAWAYPNESMYEDVRVGGFEQTVPSWFDKEQGEWVDLWASNKADGVVMQYTGLKDKNGKEIYEGDILKITRRDVSPAPISSDETFYTATIGYAGSQFQADDNQTHGTWHWGGWHQHEIIGNIYENPELLANL